MIPLLLYTDDTSGNRNKFDSWCFLLAGLPKAKNSQLHNIHFIGCSNKCSKSGWLETTWRRHCDVWCRLEDRSI